MKFFQEFLLIPRDLHSQDFLFSSPGFCLVSTQTQDTTPPARSLKRVHLHIKAFVSNVAFTNDVWEDEGEDLTPDNFKVSQ